MFPVGTYLTLHYQEDGKNTTLTYRITQVNSLGLCLDCPHNPGHQYILINQGGHWVLYENPRPVQLMSSSTPLIPSPGYQDFSNYSRLTNIPSYNPELSDPEQDDPI